MTRNSGSRSHHTTYDTHHAAIDVRVRCAKTRTRSRTEVRATTQDAAFARVLHFPHSLAPARFRGERDERGAGGHTSESSEIH